LPPPPPPPPPTPYPLQRKNSLVLNMEYVIAPYSLFSIGEKHASEQMAPDIRAKYAWGLARLLRNLPFAVPFEQRAQLFQRMMAEEREAHEGYFPFHHGGDQFVTAHRARIYEDAFDMFGGPEGGMQLRQAIRVHLINEHGLDEAGIDGGGLRREFVQEVLRTGFNPDAGFFAATGDRRLYPNPTNTVALSQALPHYNFLGRMLGRALYDGMTVDVPLAPFFLNRILGRSPNVHDLAILDPELYRNLMFLKASVYAAETKNYRPHD
jgi:ubiquitin-protein ligase E3 C